MKEKNIPSSTLKRKKERKNKFLSFNFLKMIALIQRVTKAKVKIKNQTYSQIGKGYLVLLGVFQEDNKQDSIKLADKLAHLRILNDSQKKLNRSILDIKGEILVVSQFTLCADTSKGRRPSFIAAKPPQEAERLYQVFIQRLKEKDLTVKSGLFGEYMEIQIFNDGPVTIILDSKKL